MAVLEGITLEGYEPALSSGDEWLWGIQYYSQMRHSPLYATTNRFSSLMCRCMIFLTVEDCSLSWPSLSGVGGRENKQERAQVIKAIPSEEGRRTPGREFGCKIFFLACRSRSVCPWADSRRIHCSLFSCSFFIQEWAFSASGAARMYVWPPVLRKGNSHRQWQGHNYCLNLLYLELVC